MWGYMAGMWLWWLAGLAVLVLFVWGMSRGSGMSPHTGPEDSPETILKRRYARGELSRDDYDRLLTDLRK